MITLREYHDRTKHSPASVRASAHGLDWDNQPLPFKIYPDLPAIALPTDLPGSRRLALDAVIGAAGGAPRPLDLATLAHLLYFSAGVLRQRRYPGGAIFYRAAACTGALYHVDAYVACATLPELAAGLYHFGPHDFALRCLRRGDQRGHVVAAAADDEAANAPVLWVLASTFWRNAWKYGARTYRHVFWDAGTLLANLLAVAAALDVPARVLTGFVDDEIAALLGLDVAREAPIAVVALGAGAERPSHPGADGPLGYETLPLSREEVAYPIIAQAQAASSLASADAVRAWRRADAPAPPPLPADTVATPAVPATTVAEPVEAVIVRRGSSRRFPRVPIPLAALGTVLHAASAPAPLDAPAPPTCYVVANAVEGLASGAYVAAPDGSGVALLRPGDFRREAGFLGLGQDLPADAAACLYWLVDLKAVFERLGDRGYRVAQLEAAIAGGRAYLAAYAVGLGATGLTFFDDDVTRFFSPHAAGKSVMFHVAIGARRPRRPAT